MKFVKITALSMALSALALAGCGGSGAGTATTGGKATVLLTDSFREDFGHVWATIYHVELVAQGGGAPVVVFDDPSGRQIDLKTLRDASGARYAFLSTATVPEGVYTGVSVTIGSTMQLFKAGVAVGNPIAVDASIPTNSSGQPVIAVTFRSPKTVSASSSATICVDFDLARFILRGSKVLPALVEGDGSGLNNPARHEKDDYHGVVSALTGTDPVLSFTLSRGRGMSVTVVTTAATALFGATLAQGSIVEVTGTLDTSTDTLVATRIEVRGAGAPSHETDEDRARAAGAARALDATNGTFTLTVARAHDLKLSQTTVKIVTSASTIYRGDAGTTQTQAAFFAALAATPNAIVGGTYDASTNTLTAVEVGVVDTTKDRGWERDTEHFRDERGRGGWGNDARHGHEDGDHGNDN
ncbi:DUF4382 domain-containing protein [Armatimonas sp.]|uniref:DUF4382 domain-containing protein n=1 Tax=Armatimonas sp. TaxID=1872638 RepID=UPI003753D4E4